MDTWGPACAGSLRWAVTRAPIQSIGVIPSCISTHFLSDTWTPREPYWGSAQGQAWMAYLRLLLGPWTGQDHCRKAMEVNDEQYSTRRNVIRLQDSPPVRGRGLRSVRGTGGIGTLNPPLTTPFSRCTGTKIRVTLRCAGPSPFRCC